MSVNGPFYPMFVCGDLMSLSLFFITTAELVPYKHSQPGCTGKYKTDLEDMGGERDLQFLEGIENYLVHIV